MKKYVYVSDDGFLDALGDAPYALVKPKPLPRSERQFKYYCDDSSSEDDERDSFENYDSYTFKSNLAQTRDNLKTSLGFYKDDAQLQQNIEKSFLVHEAAINILTSPSVGEEYFHLKRTMASFSTNKTPQIPDVAQAIKGAIGLALVESQIKVTQPYIEKHASSLAANPRKLFKALKSNDLYHLYPYSNPFKIKTEQIHSSKGSLLTALQKMYGDQELNPQHLITQKVRGQDSYKAKSCGAISTYKATTSEERYLKQKLLALNTKTTVKDFILSSMQPGDIDSATDSNHNILRSALLKSITQCLQKPECYIDRGTLPKQVTISIDVGFDNDGALSLITSSRLMTCSIKRTYKNSVDKDSLFDSVGKSFFRTISMYGTQFIETQKLFAKSGSRTDYVEIETSGQGGAYKDIALTIEKIKNKLNVTDKDIVQWVRNTLNGQGKMGDYHALQVDISVKTELVEFISALTYLLFGTEATRNPASLVTHQMMLDLVIADKLTFLSAFTHIEDKGKYIDDSMLTLATVQAKGADDKELYDHISGGLMPMSQKRLDKPGVGAVDVARLMHQLFNTSVKYSYDKSPADLALFQKQEAYDFFKRVALLEAYITKKWYEIQRVDLSLEESIIIKCEEWYGVTPLKGMVIDAIPIPLSNIFDGGLNDLPIQSLIKLKYYS